MALWFHNNCFAETNSTKLVLLFLFQYSASALTFSILIKDVFISTFQMHIVYKTQYSKFIGQFTPGPNITFKLWSLDRFQDKMCLCLYFVLLHVNLFSVCWATKFIFSILLFLHASCIFLNATPPVYLYQNWAFTS